ncbi:MAG: nitrilase-related carbon-nitrogen hydrolase, partial [Gemmatimonadota bacterium]
MNGDVLRIGVAQFAPRAFDVDANARRLADLAARADVDLVVAPELALTGYDLGDRAADVARPAKPNGGAPLAGPDPGPDVVVGLVERGAPGRVYNTVAHVRGGRILARHRKVYLPTYGMFDEGRVFARGDRVRAYDAGHGWR